MNTKHMVFPLISFGVIALVAMLLVAGCRPSEVEPTEPADASVIVATIGDHTITKAELVQRLAQSVRPQRDSYRRSAEPVTAESVLHQLLIEKAMILEGRELGYAEDESVSRSIDRYRQRRLIQAFLNDYVEENIPVSQAEIDQVLEADPNLSPERARSQVLQAKFGPVYRALYAELQEKLDLEKIERNFARAAEIHQRLLTQPAEPRGRTIFWITNQQIQSELDRDERNMVLATYTGGQFTLYDWFKTLNEIAPPGRPKDLNTAAGVERLLDRGLEPTILEAEAVLRGYHEMEELVRDIRAREDMAILGKIRMEKYQEVSPPSDEQIKAYFDENEHLFAREAGLKIDEIWCDDLATAEQVKQALADGTAFDAVKAGHSLKPDAPARNVYASSEGVFWDDLWKGEPDQIVGPVKGFDEDGIRWRVVKILEKTPPEPRPYSDSVKNQVQSAMMAQRSRDHIERYGVSLLDKFSYEIYPERIEDIDPLEVTPSEVESGQ